jgi:hypothetical protein
VAAALALRLQAARRAASRGVCGFDMAILPEKVVTGRV